jgi:hypothetical protein
MIIYDLYADIHADFTRRRLESMKSRIWTTFQVGSIFLVAFIVLLMLTLCGVTSSSTTLVTFVLVFFISVAIGCYSSGFASYLEYKKEKFKFFLDDL